MNEQYTSLGLMSGTSGDGVDASIIQSNGETKYDVIKDKYYEYERPIFQDIHKLKEKIHDTINYQGPIMCDVRLNEHERIIPKVKAGKPLHEMEPPLGDLEIKSNLI